MDFSSLLAALQKSPYLAALAIIGMLARAWVTDRSAFPITLPPAWQPIVTATAAGTLNAIASLQIGASPQVVVMSTLAWMGATGFLDGFLVAAWGNPAKAPKWARFLVVIFDQYETRTSGAPPSGPAGTGSSTGGGGGGGAQKSAMAVAGQQAGHTDESTPTLVEHVPRISSKPEPPAAARIFGAILAGWETAITSVVFVIGCMGLLFGCPTPPNLPDAPAVAGHFASQQACLSASDAGDWVTWDKTVDACRTADFRTWCARYPAAEDCAPDAGYLPAATDGGSRE